MPDKFERIEENVMDIAGNLSQKGLAPAQDALVRFFLDGERVDCIEDEDIGKDWKISCETPLISFDLGGLALIVKKDNLPETPFRRDMLEALIRPERYLGWGDLVDQAAEIARSDDLGDMDATAYWGAIVEHENGYVRISECWSPQDSGMAKELIAEMPLSGFMREGASEKIRPAAGPKM